jgi:hypothetical protein
MRPGRRFMMSTPPVTAKGRLTFNMILIEVLTFYLAYCGTDGLAGAVAITGLVIGAMLFVLNCIKYVKGE